MKRLSRALPPIGAIYKMNYKPNHCKYTSLYREVVDVDAKRKRVFMRPIDTKTFMPMRGAQRWTHIETLVLNGKRTVALEFERAERRAAAVKKANEKLAAKTEAIVKTAVTKPAPKEPGFEELRAMLRGQNEKLDTVVNEVAALRRLWA